MNGYRVRGKYIISKLLYLMQLKSQEEIEEEYRKSNEALKEEEQDDNGRE